MKGCNFRDIMLPFYSQSISRNSAQGFIVVARKRQCYGEKGIVGERGGPTVQFESERVDSHYWHVRFRLSKSMNNYEESGKKA